MISNDEHSWLPHLSFPTCQAFTPISLDGQLCYKLQVNKTTKGSDNREGLLLILDMNEDMSFPFGSSNNSIGNTDHNKFSSNLMTSDNENSAKIHIKTLSGFKSFGPGSYRMTSVKKLKGTKDFLPILRIAEGKPCLKSASVSCGSLELYGYTFYTIKDNSTLEFDN